MKSKSGLWYGWALCLAALVCAGCTAAIEQAPPLAVNPDLELVFSRGDRELVIIGADGRDPVPLLSSETTLIVPRFSPSGDQIAFYDIGTPDLPVSSVNVSLAVAQVQADGTENPQHAAEVLITPFGLPQYDLDHRLMIDDVIAPLWEPSGESLVVPHNNGIERIALSGERSALVEGERITAAALFPGGDRVVYSNGENIFVLDLGSGRNEALLNGDFVPKFGNRRIRAVAVSPDGRDVSFGLGCDVYVFDAAANTARKAFAVSHGVYWIAYLSGGKDLLVLSGKEDRRRAVVSPWASVMDGEYALVVGAVGGGPTRKLFSAHLVDVRDARPDLSPDGRYVSVGVQDGAAREIVVVAVDGSGTVTLASDGPGAFASWRPAR